MFTLVIILKVWAIEGWLVCACVCLCSVIIADTASVATVALVSVSELGPGSWHDLSPGQPQHSGDLTRELWSRSNVILQLHFVSKLAFSYLMKPIWRQYANSSVIKHWDVQSFYVLFIHQDWYQTQCGDLKWPACLVCLVEHHDHSP